MKGRPASPAVPGSARVTVRCLQGLAAQEEPGAGGKTAWRRTCGRITRCSQQARGSGLGAGRQEDPLSSCPIGFWESGSLPVWAWGPENQEDQAESFKHEERLRTQWKRFVKLELLANGHENSEGIPPG